MRDHRSRARGCISAAGALLMLSISGVVGPLSADSGTPDPATAATLAGEIAHAQKMHALFPDTLGNTQQTPPVIPKFEQDADPSGLIATFQPNGPTQTDKNAFFQDLGTNQRTCFTCHQPEDGWTVSAQHAQDRFDADPFDPLFRLVDGATCPSDDISTPGKRRKAFDLLLDKGLIRIGLPMPSSGLQFRILSVDDPYDCNTNQTTGLTSPTTGTASFYRRPLPATNLGFLSAIMWDGREPSLFSQAVDATLGHAQAKAAPSAAQQQQIVTFEGCTTADTPSLCANTPPNAGTFTAQIVDNAAGFLGADGASGGPLAIAKQLASFFIGINDPLGNNPKNIPFTSIIFTLYDAWESLKGPDEKSEARAAIVRGEQVFNTVPINITGVGGLNDVLNKPNISGFCGTCHDTPNVGNHSVKAPLNIGVANAGKDAPPVLDISGLPVFTIQCTAGPSAGNMYYVTDIGRAMISGNCTDIGKVKGPILRGLAARAPYFHNGSAATLRDVVEFYDKRFAIGLTDRQKADLVAFLTAL